MFVTVINDCHDANAVSRQFTRLAHFFKAPTTIVGVDSYSELEAAQDLIDVLDASEGDQGVILVNVAPRHGQGKKWPNGTPFAYFYYRQTLVVCTIQGYTLSLVKKLGLVSHVNLLDVPQVITEMVNEGHLKPKLKDHIIKTQFRSYEFSPRVARWITQGIPVPFEQYSLENIDDVPALISFIDNFGNCVTTLLPEDIDFTPGKPVMTRVGELTCYERLKDVPNDESGLIIGSWGIEDKRFLAIVVQGKSAKNHFNLEVGQELFNS